MQKYIKKSNLATFFSIFSCRQVRKIANKFVFSFDLHYLCPTKMNRLIYHIIAFLVVAVWGTTFVYTKLLLMAGLTAAQIFVLRFIIAYVMLLVYSLTRKHFRWFSRVWQDELLMVGLGITGGSLYFLTENSAMIYTTTTNTSLIVCMCPLFAALLIALFFRSQRLHGLQIVGTVMAAIGVAVVVLNGHFVLHLSPLGDTVFITRKVFFYGLLSMIPYFMVYPDLPSPSLVFRIDVLLNLLFLGCVASMLCYLTWNWVIKKLGAVVATNYVYFNPVVTVLFAWFILSERITVYFLMGTVLILMGLFFCNKRIKK